jgi:hypothetical protein
MTVLCSGRMTDGLIPASALPGRDFLDQGENARRYHALAR